MQKKGQIMIVINQLSVKLQNQIILKSISCTLEPGKINTFIGKSGAGKTTIFKSIVGLNAIESGSILINGKKITKLSPTERSQECGYVFQDFNLFPNLSVLQNCTDALIVHGMTSIQAQSIAYDTLKQLEMQEFINAYPSQLSGGQRQRVAIARALCLQPKALLLDEPTASLDPFNTNILINILNKLASQGLIIGISSQDMNFVSKIFNRVYLVQSGKIVEFCNGYDKLSISPLIKSFL
jgi:ABC-type polar amino acid transport system ATPase subunit